MNVDNVDIERRHRTAVVGLSGELDVAADARARGRGGRLVLVPGPPGVHRVPELTLFDRQLEFVYDPSNV